MVSSIGSPIPVRAYLDGYKGKKDIMQVLDAICEASDSPMQPFRLLPQSISSSAMEIRGLDSGNSEDRRRFAVWVGALARLSVAEDALIGSSGFDTGRNAPFRLLALYAQLSDKYAAVLDAEDHITGESFLTSYIKGPENTTASAIKMFLENGISSAGIYRVHGYRYNAEKPPAARISWWDDDDACPTARNDLKSFLVDAGNKVDPAKVIVSAVNGDMTSLRESCREFAMSLIDGRLPSLSCGSEGLSVNIGILDELFALWAAVRCGGDMFRVCPMCGAAFKVRRGSEKKYCGAHTQGQIKYFKKKQKEI